MRFQLRPVETIWVPVALAATLSACGDSDAPITGENSIISSTSVPVIGANGTDITEVNQQNFPLAGALPLPGETPGLGAALPGDQDVLGSPSALESDSATDVLAASAAAQSDFFNPVTALPSVDSNARFLSGLTLSVSRAVEFEFSDMIEPSGAFSDGTIELSKRIGDKAGCDGGSVVSSFTMNGNLVMDGSVVFSDCLSFGNTLNGEVVMVSSSDNTGEHFRVGLRSVSATQGGSSSVLDGELDVIFGSDAVRASSELMTIKSDGRENRFVRVDLLGTTAASGARSLSGTATFEDGASDEAVAYKFTDVSVVNGESVPSSGALSLVHSDGSRIEFEFETGNPDTFMYTVTQSDGIATSFLEDWENVGFIVPLSQ